MIKVSAFPWVPDFAQGLVREFRVRWALEEAGLDYEMRFIGPDDQAAGSDYRTLQPFGQVPIYEEDDLVLFESGAILRHIAERSAALMPSDANCRARVTAWLDGRDYLEGDRFTVADLLITTVLRILRHTDLVAQMSTLYAYRRRCESRPAFERAMADHMAVFAENAPEQA